MADTIVLDGDILIEQEFDGEPEAIIATSPWKFLYRTEVQATLDAEDTAARRLKTVTVPGIYTADKIIYVRVRDKAGMRPGYFYGSDVYFENLHAFKGTDNAIGSASRFIYRADENGDLVLVTSAGTTGYGVYGYNIAANDQLGINGRYHETYAPTVDGTYTVEVYAIDPPTGKTIFGQ